MRGTLSEREFERTVELRRTTTEEPVAVVSNVIRAVRMGAKLHNFIVYSLTIDYYSQASKRSSPEMATDDPWGDHESLIEALLLSENTIQNLRDTVIKQTGSVEYSTQPEQSVRHISLRR